MFQPRPLWAGSLLPHTIAGISGTTPHQMQTDSRELASQCFINRDFPQAAELLGDIAHQCDLRAWMLYLALCERSLVEPDSAAWPVVNADRRALRHAVLKSSLWRQMSTAWGYSSAPAPAMLVINAMVQAAKHSADPNPVMEFMEAYIAQGDFTREVIDVFIESVVIDLVNDLYYAKELVQGPIYRDSPEKQQQLLDRIEQKQQQLVEQRRLEAELDMLEQQRVAAAREVARQQTETVEKNEQTNGEIIQKQPEKPEEASVKNTQSRVYRPVRLTVVWRDWIHGVLRGKGVYNAILLVLVLISVARHGGARKGVRNAAQWLYQATKTGLTMALRVTYL